MKRQPNKKTIEACRAIAEERQGICLEYVYVNSATKMLWQCSNGHIWPATYNKIQQGRWCPKCAKKKTAEKRKHSLDYCCQIALSKGGECLSKSYENNKTDMIWKCENNHIWFENFGVILRGRWCVQCDSLTIIDCHQSAKDNGGMCLSIYYKFKEKLTWKCAKGHIWDAEYRAIRGGQWCPYCSRENAKLIRIETNMKNHGVEHVMQNKEIALRHASAQNNYFPTQHWKTREILTCQASYEKSVVEYFNQNKINFLWQHAVFTMPDGKTYRPDCYLTDRDLWIEIKGYMYPDAEIKWLWFHEKYPNSELWDKEKLIAMKII